MSGSHVVLVRHGETEWSRDRRHTGRTDVPLTALGREEAGEVGRRLAALRFGLVLTSPLARAADTCRLAGFAADAQLRDDLAEWDYGHYEGRTTADIRKTLPGWNLWRDGCPGGERAEDVGRRAGRVIAELCSADTDALVFAHAHLLRILAARWIGLAAERGSAFTLTTASISVLAYERETPVIGVWNDPEGDVLVQL